MARMIHKYEPDYAVPPGWIVREHLDVHGISQADFARRCGRSPKLISEIIAGKAPLEPATALQFEKVLGMDASIWLGIESAYQLHRARADEARAAAASAEWMRAFPVRALVKRGCFDRPRTDAEAVSNLLAFFGVGSVEAWHARYGEANGPYRRSPGFRSDNFALAAWLRLGEIEAGRQDCAGYGPSRFRRAVREIRGITRAPRDEATNRARALCNGAGVALVLEPPLPKSTPGGVARWLAPGKALIQLSARRRSEDRLWFAFFHEAAHILLHSKKQLFVDAETGGVGEARAGAHAGAAAPPARRSTRIPVPDASMRAAGELDAEADAWAANALVPRRAWVRFVCRSPLDEASIRAFADEQGVAPGIVVGMLQLRGIVPRNRLNGLKVRYQRSPAR